MDQCGSAHSSHITLSPLIPFYLSTGLVSHLWVTAPSGGGGGAKRDKLLPPRGGFSAISWWAVNPCWHSDAGCHADCRGFIRHHVTPWKQLLAGGLTLSSYGIAQPRPSQNQTAWSPHQWPVIHLIGPHVKTSEDKDAATEGHKFINQMWIKHIIMERQQHRDSLTNSFPFRFGPICRL